MRKTLSCFTLSVTVLIVGCAVPDTPPADEALASVLPETTAIPAHFVEDTSTGEYVLPDNWISSFNDAGLTAIVNEALANNLNIVAAASQIEAASGYAIQAGSQMKPVIAATGETQAMEFKNMAQNNSSSAALGVSWELDLWGKVRAQRGAAEASLETTIADYEYLRLSIKAQAARSWYMATETVQQLKLAEEVVELYKSTLELVDAKFELGDGDMKDVYLARADLASAEDRLKQIHSARKSAIRGLELLLGRYPGAALQVAGEFVPVPPSVPAGLPSDLLMRRPDLVSAEKRVEAAFLQTASASAARFPSISLTAGAGATDNALMNLLGAGSTFWNVGANFAAPLYTGGALQAEVDIQTANQETALALYGQKALVAFSEVETALTNEAVLAERVAFLEQIVVNNEGALSIANDQYDLGSIELIDVLAMQSRVVSSKVALISIKNARLAERINLHLSLGGDFVLPEED